MLLSLVEVSISVGARRFVQFILGPDLGGERTAGTGGDKQSPDCYRADPGPGESHSISSVLNERCRRALRLAGKTSGRKKYRRIRHSFYYGRSSTCKPTGLAPAPLIASITFTTSP